MIKSSAFFLFSIFWVNGDNTPNLCTDDIVDLIKITPSETNPGVPVPNITVGGFEYNGDAEHFVIGNTNSITKNLAVVYLPGTTDRPELSSCLLKSVSSHAQYPTIGLSYKYLSSGDKFRNGKCAILDTIDEQVNCLMEQHEDAINGGTFGLTHFKDGNPFWDGVEPHDSITARLGYLLKYLDETYPESGWDQLYSYDMMEDPFPLPKWNKLIIMGHSQGAGHAAYLAQAYALKGSVMVSGPQDECIDCPEGTSFWIDEMYETEKKFSAFASGDEPLYPVMQANWDRMTDAGATTWDKGVVTDVDFALKKGNNVCNAPLVSYLNFAPTSTCGGKEHCSTAIDDSVPFIEKSNGEKLYLYEVSVWSNIAHKVKRCGMD